jgi:hypothetical protein
VGEDPQRYGFWFEGTPHAKSRTRRRA